MFKKISIVISALVFSAFVAVSGAQAVSVDPTFFANYNNDTGAGAINDIYAFEATADTNLKFIFSVNHPQADFNVGISNLVMTWSDGNIAHIITNNLGVVVGVPFFHAMLTGANETLTVTGNFLANGGGYTLTVAAVPLPPAVIAFSTAMLGVGFLARRRRKKKEVFA
tara:strand:- start:305860 stop:306363 length:504 start_codon:yes stop_codon:yes gene_type:complete